MTPKKQSITASIMGALVWVLGMTMLFAGAYHAQVLPHSSRHASRAASRRVVYPRRGMSKCE
eukprot:6140585-Pyramimonas_sp.AAC.1